METLAPLPRTANCDSKPQQKRHKQLPACTHKHFHIKQVSSCTEESVQISVGSNHVQQRSVVATGYMLSWSEARAAE